MYTFVILLIHNHYWSGMEGVASYSHCIQDDRHVMWSMLSGIEVACSCLHMHIAVDVQYSYSYARVKFHLRFIIAN